jgi:hypothetical protein
MSFGEVYLRRPLQSDAIFDIEHTAIILNYLKIDFTEAMKLWMLELLQLIIKFVF